MIIINADDFGMSHEANLAIVEAFKRGLISNTTIMVNMPFYDEAIYLAKQNGFFDKVGLHLNFFEGKPLSGPVKDDGIIIVNGEMTSYKILHELPVRFKFFLPKNTKEFLKKECEVQIKKFLSSGFTQMHFDSHGHSHTILSIFKCIFPIFKKYGFTSSRKSLNYYPKGGKNPSIIKKIYKSYYNDRKISYFKNCNYFLSSNPMLFNEISDDKSYEIMVHPKYENNVVTDGHNNNMETIKTLLNNVEYKSFNEL